MKLSENAQTLLKTIILLTREGRKEKEFSWVPCSLVRNELGLTDDEFWVLREELLDENLITIWPKKYGTNWHTYPDDIKIYKEAGKSHRKYDGCLRLID